MIRGGAAQEDVPVDKHEVGGDALCLQLLSGLDALPRGGNAQQETVPGHAQHRVLRHDVARALQERLCAAHRDARFNTRDAVYHRV